MFDKKEYGKQYYQQNKQRILERDRERYVEVRKNNPVWKEHQKEYYQTHKTEYRLYRKTYVENNKEKVAEQDKNRRLRHLIKSRIIERLRNKLLFIKYLWTIANGFPSCVRCDKSNIELLNGDHINGGGGKEQKAFGGQHKMYRYYISHQEEARKKLQVLCANCNMLKAKEMR